MRGAAKGKRLLKKSGGVLCEGEQIEKYHFIDRYSKRFGINWLLRKFRMSPNAYYNYCKHRKNAKEKKKAPLKSRIQKLYHDSEGKPGYRMMHQILINEGHQVSVQTVRRYMNVELGLKSVTRRRRRYHYVSGSSPL